MPYESPESGDIPREASATQRSVEKALEGGFDHAKLMHPSERLFHVISELTNEPSPGKKSAKNYLSAIGVEDYDEKKAVENFYEFVDRIRGDKSPEQMIEQLYNWYYASKYERIYKEYEKMYLSKFDEAKKNKEFLIFKEVFPELGYRDDGKYREVPLPEGVTDINDYRKGVSEQVKEIDDSGEKAA